MAKSLSVLKRERQMQKRKLKNKIRKTKLKNALKKIKSITSKKEAIKLYPEIESIIDKSAKVSGIIHKNKAARLKSQITKYIQSLS